jgi:hypothetical protein
VAVACDRTCRVFRKHEVVEVFVVFTFLLFFLSDQKHDFAGRIGLFAGMGDRYTAGLDELEPIDSMQLPAVEYEGDCLPLRPPTMDRWGVHLYVDIPLPLP